MAVLLAWGGAGQPGGTLAIDVPMSSEQVSEWTEVVSFLLWVNGGGATHTFDEYRAWLELAGFTQVAKLSERWASGTRRAERRRASSA